MEKLEIKTEALKEGGAWSMKVAGSIDVFSYRELKGYFDAWHKERGAGPQRLILDLSATTYIGSSGWSVIFLESASLEKDSGVMAIHGMSERVQRSLDLIMPRKRGIQVAAGAKEALDLVINWVPQPDATSPQA